MLYNLLTSVQIQLTYVNFLYLDFFFKMLNKIYYKTNIPPLAQGVPKEDEVFNEYKKTIHLLL